MSTILFATWQGLPGLAEDDRAAARALLARGHGVHAVAWDDAAVNWTDADAIVVRSCWDYHLRPAEFFAWLDVLGAVGAPIWNPAATLRWNAHKGYLLELAEAGIPVVPSVLLAAGQPRDLSGILRGRGWPDAIVKPAIAASAWGARFITPDTADDPASLEEWRGHDVLVQPLVPEVAASGEWSLVFIGGEFSHAARKRPGPGDFRVQHELGGSIEPGQPPDGALTAAWRVLDRVPAPWLYARIDLVLMTTGFVLMEAELLEPSLFLDLDDGAPARFADAIEAILRG